MSPDQKKLIDGKYSFNELVDIDRLRKIFESFSEATGFAAGLVSYPDQNLLIGVGWQDICTKFHRAFPGSELNCRQSNMKLSAHLDEHRELKIHRCKFGLVEGVAPIIIRDRHVANLLTGQILLKKPDLAHFRKQAETYGYDVDAYLEALQKVPVVPEEKIRNALVFLSEMAVLVAEQGLGALQNLETVQAVQKSEEQLRVTLNSIGDAVIATDIVGKVTRMNAVAESLTGWSLKEAYGKDLRDIFHIINSKTGEDAENPIDKVLRIGKIFGLSNHTILKSRDGKEYQIADSAAPIIDERGQISGVVLVFRDVTEKYRMQEAIEKRLVALTQPLESGTITFDELFDIDEIQRIQDEFAQATGVASIITLPDGTPITRASNFTRLCSEIIRKTEPGCLNCYKSDAAIGRCHPEGPIVQQCLSGGLWDAGASITVGGKHVANWLIGQVRDETQTEDKMRAYAREIGADESAFMEAFRKVPAMPRKHFEEIAQALFTLAKQLSREAYQNIMQARYIAERKRVEEDLRQSEAKNRAILNSVPDIMFIQSIDGVFLDYHADDKKLLAVQPEQFLGKSVRDVLPPELADQFLQCFRLAHETKEMQVMTYLLDVPSGSRYFEARINYMDEGRVLSIIRDITENKRAEAELQKMQKLTSVGTLAGGIAHDFNNILMGLYGNLSLAKDELDQNHPAFEPLEDAEKSMNRAIRLTKQLLTFAKGGDPVKEDVSLGILVEEVARFDLSGSNVKLVYEQAEDLWLAEVDKGQMQQVISNLTINAREAMPNGGRLHIRLENVEIREAEIPGLHKGKYIMITVRDEGTGIENKYLERIFDPYFTTKQTGSGLGLATTYSIISKHGGHIRVVSELGKGTNFTLYLPASESHLLEETNETSNEKMDFGRDVRILVMDDEEDILLLVSKMLRMYGYSVATAADGKKAVEMYRQSFEAGEPFDIVIADLTIPGGLGGKEAVRQIMEIDPKAVVIASSGYANDPIMANYAEYGFRGIVAKPYTKAELSKLLVRILK